jgi:hypothetical protein
MPQCRVPSVRRTGYFRTKRGRRVTLCFPNNLNTYVNERPAPKKAGLSICVASLRCFGEEAVRIEDELLRYAGVEVLVTFGRFVE